MIRCKKSQNILLILSLFTFVSYACGNGGGANGGSGGDGTTITVRGADGLPLSNVYWSATNTGFPTFPVLREAMLLGFMDSTGQTCFDPGESTPQVANADADQNGCTDANGNLNVICTPGTTITLHFDNGGGNRTESAEVSCPGGNGAGINLDHFVADFVGYVALASADEIGVLDIPSSTIIDNIATLDDGPQGFAINSDNSRLYACNGGFAPVNLSVIDLATNALVTNIPLDALCARVVVSPDDSRVYVTLYGGAAVQVINTTTNTVIDSIPVGTLPHGLAIHPNGTRLYVGNEGSGNVSVVDTAINMSIDTIPVGNNPSGLAISANGSRLYVSNEGDGTISVINTETNAVIDTITGLSGGRTITLNNAGDRLYSVDIGNDLLWVVNVDTLTAIDDVPVGETPAGVAVTPDDAFILVTNNNDQTISVVSAANLTVVETFAVGSIASFIVIPGSPQPN